VPRWLTPPVPSDVRDTQEGAASIKVHEVNPIAFQCIRDSCQQSIGVERRLRPVPQIPSAIVVSHIVARLRRGHERPRGNVTAAIGVDVPAPNVRFGAFRLDRAQGRLWRDDTAVPLTPKAHAVLDCLLAEPGRLVTKPELLCQGIIGGGGSRESDNRPYVPFRQR
jgi:hypothetical protein